MAVPDEGRRAVGHRPPGLRHAPERPRVGQDQEGSTGSAARHAGRRQARRAGRPEQAADRRVPRRVGRGPAPGTVDRRQLPQEHPSAPQASARRGAAGRADYGEDRPAVPRARARRPRRPPGRRGPVTAHHPLRAHDPVGRAGRRGEDPPPGPQPCRRHLAAHREAGEVAGNAPVDRRAARHVPGLVTGQQPEPALWHVLAYTGMRRGELLALRWQDIDLDAATVSVRRSVGAIKHKGGPGRSGKATPRRPGRGPSTSTRPQLPSCAPGSGSVG